MGYARQDNFKKQSAFNYPLKAPLNLALLNFVHKNINIHKAEVGEKKKMMLFPSSV